MSYSAKSLEEIAVQFEARAAELYRLQNPLESRRRLAYAEAFVWRRAADILRRTTLTEPCHTSKLDAAASTPDGEAK